MMANPTAQVFALVVTTLLLVQGQQDEPPYTTCDEECQHQVKILEGIIAFVILGFALGVALCFMKCIDTPTKFASPAKDRRQQD